MSEVLSCQKVTRSLVLHVMSFLVSRTPNYVSIYCYG